jgi:hypothetical protein
MTTQQLAERAAGVLRRRGYTVVDNSWSFDDITKRVECGLWHIQFFNSPQETCTDRELIEKAKQR